MKNRSFLLFITMMMLISVVLMACNNEKTEGKKESDSSENSSNSTLVFGRGGDTVNLDPAVVTDGESFRVTKNIFETLIEFDEDSTDLIEGLATDWKVSDDGLTYTLTLREGVKFHDGSDFNAEAVVYNFTRWASGDKEKYYYYNSQFGDVITDVKAENSTTVVITTSRPIAPFFKNLAMSPFAIASPKALKEAGDDFGSKVVVGTGPFVFKEWKANETITLDKNPDYWKEGLPKLDTVIFKVIPDNAARFNALQAGEVDIIEGINYSDLPTIEANADLQVFQRPSLNVAYLGLTSTRGPLKDKKVRQALNYAVNKKAIIEAFYSGSAIPAINPMPPVVAGYNPDVEDYPYDPEKAKELLAEAGFTDGFEIELWAMPVVRPYMPDGPKVAEAIQADFEAIGVKSKIVQYEWATYLEKTRLGEADTFLLGWTGDNGDADNFLYVLLDKDNIGSNNYSYYSNDEVHNLLIEAQSTVDQVKREELYKQAQVIIKEDAPWIPLVHSNPVLAGSTKVKNFIAHPTGSDWLDQVELVE